MADPPHPRRLAAAAAAGAAAGARSRPGPGLRPRARRETGTNGLAIAAIVSADLEHRAAGALARPVVPVLAAARRSPAGSAPPGRRVDVRARPAQGRPRAGDRRGGAERARGGRLDRADRRRLLGRGASAEPRAGARTAAAGRPANLFARDPEPLRQAVPDDRRADARAARRLAGDGRADALPPRPGVRRALRAGAGQAALRLPDREPRARLRRQRLGRDGVRRRQPRAPRRPGARLRRGQVRRALDRAVRRLRRPDASATSRAGASASTRPRSTAC